MKTQGTLYMLRGLFFFVIFSNSAMAHPLVEAWQNRTGSGSGWSIAPNLTYFSTDQNFNNASLSTDLINKIQVERYYFDLYASYGFNENFFLYGRLSGIYTSITGSGLNNQTSIGLSDQMIGAAFRIVQTDSGLSLSLQSEVTLPAYSNSNSKTQGKPWLGDQSYDFTAGGFIEVPLLIQTSNQYYLDAGAGMTLRSYGHSSSVPWSVLLKKYPTNYGLIASLGARGNYSLNNDSQTELTGKVDSDIGAGGSFLINGINSNWMLFQASLGYQSMNKVSYQISGALPISGKNSANGIQVSMGIKFDFEEKKSEKNSNKLIQSGAFKQYDLEGKILSINDQLYLIKIDQGLEQGIEKGQNFDIFSGKKIIAKAKVTHVKNNESALRVIEYLQEQSIEIDDVAKRVVQDP